MQGRCLNHLRPAYRLHFISVLKLSLLKMKTMRLAATNLKELEFLGSMHCHLPIAAAAASPRNSSRACRCTATCTSV